MVFCMEVLGWGILAALGVKAFYNMSHFLYSAYLARILVRNLDPRNYGPWAGEFHVPKHVSFLIIK